MAGKKDIQDLSDWELLNELKSLGLKVGPISPTTRRIYEKKLSKVRGCDVVDNTQEDRNTRVDVLADESTKLTNAVTDNCTSRALESPAVFLWCLFWLGSFVFWKWITSSGRVHKQRRSSKNSEEIQRCSLQRFQDQRWSREFFSIAIKWTRNFFGCNEFFISFSCRSCKQI